MEAARPWSHAPRVDVGTDILPRKAPVKGMTLTYAIDLRSSTRSLLPWWKRFCRPSRRQCEGFAICKTFFNLSRFNCCAAVPERDFYDFLIKVLFCVFLNLFSNINCSAAVLDPQPLCVFSFSTWTYLVAKASCLLSDSRSAFFQKARLYLSLLRVPWKP